MREQYLGRTAPGRDMTAEEVYVTHFNQLDENVHIELINAQKRTTR
mgnify:CR=1 FL=1